MEIKSDNTKSESIKHAKFQIAQSNMYAEVKDIVNALLLDEKKYTLSEVDALIKEYRKGKVR